MKRPSAPGLQCHPRLLASLFRRYWIPHSRLRAFPVSRAPGRSSRSCLCRFVLFCRACIRGQIYPAGHPVGSGRFLHLSLLALLPDGGGVRGRRAREIARLREGTSSRRTRPCLERVDDSTVAITLTPMPLRPSHPSCWLHRAVRCAPVRCCRAPVLSFVLSCLAAYDRFWPLCDRSPTAFLTSFFASLSPWLCFVSPLEPHASCWQPAACPAPPRTLWHPQHTGSISLHLRSPDSCRISNILPATLPPP